MEHFNLDNTEGYSQAELDELNRRLNERLNGIEPYTDEWHEAIKRFSDQVGRE